MNSEFNGFSALKQRYNARLLETPDDLQILFVADAHVVDAVYDDEMIQVRRFCR